MPHTLFDWSKKQTKLALSLSILLIILVYVMLHGRYILYNGDDAWSMTRIYHYFMTGENVDTIFRAVETDEKTQIFYATFNTLYGTLLNWFGWTKSNGHIICTILIALSCWVWYFILKQLKFSKELSVFMALSMMLFPVFFGVANLTRADALAFLLTNGSFLLFIHKRYFFAAFVLLVATETHVMGSMGSFYMLAFALSKWKDHFGNFKRFMGMALRFLAGVILGFGYYYWMHRDVFSVQMITDTLGSYNKMGNKKFKHYFVSYFVRPEWHLHVWEFFFILITLILYFVKGVFRKEKFVWIFMTVLVVSSFILSRPNAGYMLYMFPGLILMAFYTFEQMGKLKGFVYVMGIIFLLHYTWIYYTNHTYNFNNIITQTEASIPDKSVAVVGMPDNWFAAKEHPFYLIYNSIKDVPDQGLTDLYLIRNDYKHDESLSLTLELKMEEAGLVKDALLKKRRKHYFDLVNYFLDNYDCKELNRFPAFKGKDAVIYRCKSKKENF